MKKGTGCAAAARLSFSQTGIQKVNPRPGEVVCICEKSGNVSLWDPGAWRRTMTLHYRKANEGG